MRAFRRTKQTNRFHRASERNRGFTLLEMLVTASLSAVLMMGLWNLFGTYLRLFSSGQDKAEHSQLVRALTQQFSDDLTSVLSTKTGGVRVELVRETHDVKIEVGLVGAAETRPTSTSPTTSPTNNIDANFADSSSNSPRSRPGFGLIGTQQTLRLDILRTVPPSSGIPIADSIGDAASTEPNRIHRPMAPQLRSILYTFEEPREVQSADRDAPPGLIRREFDWEAVSAQAEANTSRFEQPPLQIEPDQSPSGFSMNDSVEHLGFPKLSVADLDEAHLDDESIFWVREMIGLRFRYFDGHGWHTHWDSYQRRALPVAVEIVMQIVVDRNEVAEDSQQSDIDESDDTTLDESSGSLESSLNADQSNDDLNSDRFEAHDSSRPIYRQVVYLSAAGFRRGGNDSSAVSPSGSAIDLGEEQ